LRWHVAFIMVPPRAWQWIQKLLLHSPRARPCNKQRRLWMM
jgi:hypothetical protein